MPADPPFTPGYLGCPCGEKGCTGHSPPVERVVQQEADPPRVYVASKSRYGHLWRGIRDEWADRLTVTSTWIDESGEGETDDNADLWLRCVTEAATSDALVAVHEAGDDWKGAYVEIGAALAHGKPVFYVGAPPGSWVHHPLATECSTLDEAMAAAALAATGEADGVVTGSRDDLTAALAALARREHYYCDDCWYSCPKAPEGSCNEAKGVECDCGADAHNAEVERVAALLAEGGDAEGPSFEESMRRKHPEVKP